MLELLHHQPIFIGFKASSNLKRQLESLSGPDKKYVSIEDSSYLRICWMGKDLHVGKVIHERLTTEPVDDVRRNVLSILRRLARRSGCRTISRSSAAGRPSLTLFPRATDLSSDPFPSVFTREILAGMLGLGSSVSSFYEGITLREDTAVPLDHVQNEAGNHLPVRRSIL